MLKGSYLIVREWQNVFMSYNNNKSFLPLLKVFKKKKKKTKLYYKIILKIVTLL